MTLIFKAHLICYDKDGQPIEWKVLVRGDIYTDGTLFYTIGEGKIKDRKRQFGTYRWKHGQKKAVLVKSKALPPQEDPHQAERDFLAWAEKRGLKLWSKAE